MKEKISKIFLVEIGILLTLVAFIFLVSLVPAKIMEETAEGELSFPKIAEKVFVTDIFVAKNNYLNRIDILFKNPNLLSRDEIVIGIYNENNLIVEKHFSGFNFGDTSRARLDFEPINNSLGKTFIIEVKTTKVVDGKLAIGIRGNKIDSAIYYKSASSFVFAVMNTVKILELMIMKQIVILLIPMLFGIWLIW